MIHEKAMLVCLSLGLPPVAKTDKRLTDKQLAETGAARGSLRTVKRLLPDQALEAVREIDRELDEYWRRHTCAWSDKGERVLNSAIFMDFSDHMRRLATKREALADDFCANYQGYIDEARRQLNGAFREADYLSLDRVRRRFRYKLEFSPIPDGADFRISVAREAMDELRRSVDEKVREATRTVKADLANRIADPLAKLVNRLSDPEATFRDTLVTNLRAICDLIPTLNITGDPRLEAVRQQIYSDLYRTEPDTLRENPTVRASAARKAQEILDRMSGYFGEAEAIAA